MNLGRKESVRLAEKIERASDVVLSYKMAGRFMFWGGLMFLVGSLIHLVSVFL